MLDVVPTMAALTSQHHGYHAATYTEQTTDAFIEPPEWLSGGRENTDLHDQQQFLADVAASGIERDLPIDVNDIISGLQALQRGYNEEAIRRVYSMAQSTTTPGSVEPVVTIKRFSEMYFKRRRELLTMLESTWRELEQTEGLLQEAEEKSRKAQASERSLPNSQIMENSKLTVQVVSLLNLPSPTVGGHYRVHLECQSQAIETQQRMCANGVYWNEMFSFQISSREGGISFKVIQNDAQGEQVIGDCSILLEELADQKKHEIAKELWGLVGSEMLLSCQWIYSKKLLYQNYVREFTHKRNVKLRDINEYQSEYSQLNQPFTTQISACSIGHMITQGSESFAKWIDQTLLNLKLTNRHIASQYLVAVSLLLGCISSYARPLFFDLLITVFICWSNLDAKRWSLERYTMVLRALGISIVLDVIWMRIYFHEWVIATQESEMQNISKMFSLLNLLWKLIVIAFIWKSRFDLKKKLAYQQRMEQLHQPPLATFQTPPGGTPVISQMPLMRGPGTPPSRMERAPPALPMQIQVSYA